MKIIAQCIATAGYCTSSYDPETHECYASVDRVILNEEYWKPYDDAMSNALNSDFGLGFNFDTYELIVFEDGSRHSKKVR